MTSLPASNTTASPSAVAEPTPFTVLIVVPGLELGAADAGAVGLVRILAGAGNRVADPVWRLPFWAGYETNLDSPVADMNNVSDGPFAGSVTAALFLRRFVRQARSFVHFDIYGWRPALSPLGPKGGEPQAARAVFEALLETTGK